MMDMKRLALLLLVLMDMAISSFDGGKGTLKGFIVNEHGHTLPRVEIAIYAGVENVVNTITDGRGNFTVKLEEGYYKVRIIGYREGYEQKCYRDVLITANETVEMRL